MQKVENVEIKSEKRTKFQQTQTVAHLEGWNYI